MFSSVGELLRSLFLYLDKVVYRLMGNLYELFIEIASVNFFSDDTITTFAARVYGLLAIFMLFRISFSILTYIVNPDSINDKTAGSGRLIGNFLITIIMLISAPWLFMQAMNLQKTILQENIIGKIILGVGSDEAISYQFGAGYEMGWTTFSAFFYPNIGTCNRSNLNYVPYEYNESNPSSNSCCNDMGADGQCKTWHHLTVGKYVNAIDGDVVNAIVKTNGVETEVYEYNYGVSTLAGVFICYILLLFCIQIAVRSVKFGFLQLIAPIPIISYIDPKHGKDGMFKKWLKVCGKTYADIFIRLAAIYFALFIITEIGQSGAMINTITNKPAGPLAKVLIIMGALMFAKELPKFIEEITGIKLDGGFSLNPFKNNPFLSAAAGGLVGAGLGTVGALTGGGALDGLTGAFRGMRSGFGGKKLGEIASGQIGANAKMRTARLNGSTFGGRLRNSVGGALGFQTDSQRIESQIHGIDEQIKDIDNANKPLEDSIADRKAYTDKVKSMEDRAMSKIRDGEAGVISTQYKALMNRAERLREDMRNGRATEAQVAAAEIAANNYLTNTGMQDYIDYTTGFSNQARMVDLDGNAVAGQFANVGNVSDATMQGMFDDLLSMTATEQTYSVDGSATNTVTMSQAEVRAGAASRHSNAGRISGSTNYDTRTTISESKARKQQLEQEKAALYDQQRRAKANEDATKR